MSEQSNKPNLSRTAFLRGAWGKAKNIIRPPWALAESDFIEQCDSGCQACITACPENIIVIGRGNYPYIDFNKGECTFCEKCVDTCSYDALNKQANNKPWLNKAVIDMSKCITQQSVICRSCSEICEVAAITFRPSIGGVSSPELVLDKCNGCGACLSVCPSSVITISATVDLGQ